MSPGQVLILVDQQPDYVILLQGDIYADPALLLPTVSDKKNLAKVYDVVSTE